MTTMHKISRDFTIWRYLLDVSIIFGMIYLLDHGGRLREHIEQDRYQCYALAFWKGTRQLGPLLSSSCSFLETNSTSRLIHQLQIWGFPGSLISFIESQSQLFPFHTLPQEYPLLSIIPFTFGLFVHIFLLPAYSYPIAYFLFMMVVVVAVYVVLRHFRSTKAAIACAIYLVIGSWATAITRIDLIPAGLTLGAVICAGRSKWKWAFLLLALATLFKFYALILVPPFLIAQQMQHSGNRWYAWQRWDGLVVFVATCVVVTGLSLLLSVDGTLAPIEYYSARPIQIESLLSLFVWFGSFFGYPLQYASGFGSYNVLSPLSSYAFFLSTVCLVIGLLFTYWLQLRDKLDLVTASLLALLIIMITGKVFSPQYLIWVTPLIAYIGGTRWKWLITWVSVGSLTTWIWPYHYSVLQPLFYPALLARNLIIVAMVIVLLFHAARAQRKMQFEHQRFTDSPQRQMSGNPLVTKRQ